MIRYTTIKNLRLLRFISRLFPLKHKLAFLIKDYLNDGTELAIRYYKNWYVCTTVNKINRSTIEEVILSGTYSQPEVSLIKHLRNELPDNMVFIDIGGNIGTFMCQFVDKCDQVFVFEPIPRLNSVIKRSVEHNKSNKVTVIEKAAGDRHSIVKMLDNNNSSIVDSGASGDVLDIPVTTLDDELGAIEKIDFIKIDVEGYEVSVLNGARKIIEKHRPAILVEVHPMYLEQYGQQHADVIHFFEEQKYAISYYSFLEELRMPRWERIFSRWWGNKGIKFSTKEDFLNDIYKQPRLSSYHFYCEPA